MKREIKVCGMTLPEQMTAVRNADYIGMIFHEPSPRHVLRAHIDRMPMSTPARVGVFVDYSIKSILELSKVYKLSVIQLHGKETPDFCQKVLDSGLDCWKAISVENEIDLQQIGHYENVVSRIVLDTRTPSYGGSGSKFDWSVLNSYRYKVPFMLAGGIGPEDAEFLSNYKHPALIGFDINSKFEISPGIKDITLVNKFISKIKS